MKNRKTHFSFLLVALFVLLYLASFFGASLVYLFSGIRFIFSGHQEILKPVFLWTSVGLSLSLLATLTCWPFALSAATLIEHNRSRWITPYILRSLSYFSTLPLIVFIYVYIEVVGVEGFDWLKEQWIVFFASPNFLTKSVAFALTLLLYPLTAFPFLLDRISVDQFFKNMLSGVIEFAEVGLVALVVVAGLYLYILPKMILHMRRQLKQDENLRSFEIIQSLGGTSWESIHLTVMQSMRNRFNSIVTYFTRICFFEGLITYSLLYYFVLEDGTFESHWGASLSSIFIFGSLDPGQRLSFLLAIAGFMVLCYLLFMRIESLFRRKSEANYV